MNASELLRRHVRDSFPTLCLLQSLVLVRTLLGGTGFMLVIPALNSLSLPVTANDPKLQFLLSLIPVSGSLTDILLLFLLLMISMAAISYYNDILEEKVEQAVITSLRKEIFQLTLDAEWQYVGGIHRAHYSRIQTDEVQSLSSLLRYLMEMTTVLITLTVYFFLCLYLSPTITLIAAVLGISLLIIVYPLQRLIINSGARHLNASEHLYRQTGEQINGIRAIKSSRSESRQQQKFDGAVDTLREEELRYTKLSSLTQLLNTSIAAVAFCVLAWAATTHFKTDTAVLVVIALVFSRLLPLISHLQTLAQRIAFMFPGLEEVTNYVADLEQHQEQEIAAGPVPDLNHGLVVTNVEYRYPTAQKRALKNLNIRIPPRSLTLVTGSSGIGKTTFADIIAGLILPDNGQVIAGDIQLSRSNARAWRCLVTYVPQVPFLIDASVRENLCLLTDQEIEDQRLRAALEQASASFIFLRPDGLDTIIGEDGSRLSAGERQRLLLARALLEDTPLLILDESTSNLDTETELAFLNTLGKLKTAKTIILISHKRYLADIVDQVVVIDEPDGLSEKKTTVKISN